MSHRASFLSTSDPRSCLTTRRAGRVLEHACLAAGLVALVSLMDGLNNGTPAVVLGAMMLSALGGAACHQARRPVAVPVASAADEPALPEALRLPPAYRTPLERAYGSRLLQVLPDTLLNVVDIGADHPLTLLFVHGDAGSFDYWRPQIEHFKDRYRVVAYERAECGRSIGPVNALTYSTSADHITRLVAELGITSYVVIGHSRGQELAAFHFATAPKGLAGLVAEGTGVTVSPDPTARAEAERAVERHRHGDHDLRMDCLEELSRPVRVFAPAMGVSEPDALDLLKYACGRWRPSVGIMGGPDVDVRSQLARLDLPMLQIDGAAYRPGRDRRQAMQRFFRRGQLVMLDGVGHVPHLEAPAEFNRQVERFLADIGFR